MTGIENAEESDLPIGLAKPAKRALAGARLFRLEQFTEIREEEVSALHGIGPNALEQIRDALNVRGLSFMQTSLETEISTLYSRIIEGWNNRSAEGMASQFTADGELIGFDGSQVIGRDHILEHLQPIFENNPTAPFISVIKKIEQLSPEVSILRGIVGMVPNGQVEIDASLNAHQTLIAVKKNDQWFAKLLQNTPAQFHGRPALIQEMTEELRTKYVKGS